MLGIASMICLLAAIVELIRFLMIPSEATLWDSLSSSNAQQYLTLLSLKQTLAGDIFIFVILCCVFSIPVAVIHFDDPITHSKNLKTGDKFRRFISHLSSSVVKTILIECVLLLEVSFMLTSHVLWVDNLQNFVFYQILPLVSPTQASIFKTWDIYCFVLLIAVLLSAFIEYARNNGTIMSVLKSIRVAALLILSLGIQIFLFDSSEFNIRAAIIESSWGLSWFTNADLFSASLAMVFITTLVIGFSNNGFVKKQILLPKKK